MNNLILEHWIFIIIVVKKIIQGLDISILCKNIISFRNIVIFKKN